MCPEFEYPELRHRITDKEYKCSHGRIGVQNCPWCRINNAIGVLIADTGMVRNWFIELEKDNAALRKSLIEARDELEIARNPIKTDTPI